MSKNVYRTFAREKRNDEELAAAEAEAYAAANVTTTADAEPEVLESPEEKSFKKRYGDLRSYSQKREDELKAEINALKTQMQGMADQNFKYPKTEAEVEDWLSKYPDVGKIVETIALRVSHKTKAELDERIKVVESREQTQRERDAYRAFLEAHPDFETIRSTQEWEDWVELQPKYIYDALYENSTDAQAAIRAVDLYKADRNKTIKKAPERETRNDAAHSVRTPSTGAPSAGSGKVRFTESMVAKMSQREYDANEAAIDEAMLHAEFYDQSGGAR